MAEELNNTPIEDEFVQATQAIENEAVSEVEAVVEEVTAPVEEAFETADTVEEAFQDTYAQAGDPTELIELPAEELASPMPTERLETMTEEIPVPTTPTTPMPNPFTTPQDTTPFPTPAPEPTTAGFDVPLGSVDLEGPTPTTAAATFEPTPSPVQPASPVEPANPIATNDPYAAAVAAATPAAAAVPPFAAAARQVSPGPGTYAQPGYQQPVQPGYQQPTYAQPTYGSDAYQNAVSHQPFAPDPMVNNPYEYSFTSLTGGMKFGWLLIGLFLTIPGMLLAWLVNADKHPQVKKDAITWSVVGFAINVFLGIVFTVAFASLVAAAVSSMGGYYGSPF